MISKRKKIETCHVQNWVFALNKGMLARNPNPTLVSAASLKGLPTLLSKLVLLD